MTSILTNRAKYRALKGTLSDATDYRALLLRGTAELDTLLSAGLTQVRDLNFVSELLAVSGVQEISVSGYSRQTLGTKTVAEDDTNDRALLDVADIAFGTLTTGQTVNGIAIYVHDADGDGASDLIMVSDEGYSAATSGAPRPTNGGPFSTPTPNGLIRAS